MKPLELKLQYDNAYTMFLEAVRDNKPDIERYLETYKKASDNYKKGGK